MKRFWRTNPNSAHQLGNEPGPKKLGAWATQLSTTKDEARRSAANFAKLTGTAALPTLLWLGLA
jgi:hypothetical protein